MVRTLSSPLTTALNALTRRPGIQITAEDHILHYSSYQTPGTADAWNDACVAADGSIIRVRLTRGGNQFQQSFQYQRIADPSVASQWSTWTTFGSGVNNMFQDGGCAVSYNATAGEIRAFAQQGTGGNALWYWRSTDNGQTWTTAPVAVLSPPGSALTKGIASCGNNDVFFIYDVAGGENIGCSFYSGGTWSALSAWTLSAIVSGAGLAVWYGSPGPASTYTVIYSDSYSLKSATCNSVGGNWLSGQDVAPATSTAIGRISPRLFWDQSALGGQGLMHLVCVESDSGLITGSVYSYPRVRQSADLVHWSNGVIYHDLGCSYGAAAFKCTPPSGGAGTRYYLANMAAVFSTQAFSTGNASQYLDVSAAVLSYSRQEQADKPSRLEVTLDNTNGVYNSLIALSSSYGKPIGMNTLLVLKEGYYIGTPPTTPTTVQTGTYHINQILFERSPDQNQIRLLAYDLSRNLDLECRYQMTYSNLSLSYLITEICARAGLFQLALPNTSQMSQGIVTFVLHAGQTYRKALDGLCNLFGLDYFLDQNEVLQFRELSSSDTPVWSYQPEIELLSFGGDDLRANHVIVSGKPPTGGQAMALTTAEVYDDTNVHAVGLERLLHITDQKLTTTGQCSLRASLTLAQEQRTMLTHKVTVPLNPALQLLDVVSLADTGSGQSGNARIIESVVRYDAQHAEYDMILTLEGA
jgi:hypothetical protein